MFRVLFAIGLLLCIPAACVLDTALSAGPASWAVDQSAFWGTPVSNFVFWIGLAHAGTFFSAILCALSVRWGRRIAFPAEISTVAAISVAAVFPLVHLGIPLRFYFLFPFGVARNLYVNAESPLVWDFVAIGAYFALSVIFLALHALSVKRPEFGAYRKPFAWILFPLVLWVHTLVSLDFAVTYRSAWHGAYLPVYFIIGALYSGVALVLILCEAEKRRIRHLEELLLTGSWVILPFWIWEFLCKGVWNPGVLIFGFLFPQFLWIKAVRNTRLARVALAFSVVLAMWMERLHFVMPASLDWTPVDYGWLALGAGVFLSLYFGLRLWFQKRNVPVCAPSFSAADRPAHALPRRSVLSAWCAGFAVTLAWVLWFKWRVPAMPWVRFIPVAFPAMALVAGLVLFARAFSGLVSRRTLITVCALCGIAAGVLCAAVYRGGDTLYVEPRAEIASEAVPAEPRDAAHLWRTRCVACHGEDGNRNYKFVREFFPLPTEFSAARLDSLGTDSLAKVILDGRNYMSPQRGRISEAEAHNLALYMRFLAGGAK